MEQPIEPREAEHWNRIREQRGWSWTTLAAAFDRAHHDPESRALAAWARANADAALAGKRPARAARAARGETETR